jgi:hypothetical protein
MLGTSKLIWEQKAGREDAAKQVGQFRYNNKIHE